MRSAQHIAALLSVLVLGGICCLAQTPVRESSASISGRVTIAGKVIRSAALSQAPPIPMLRRLAQLRSYCRTQARRRSYRSPLPVL